MIAVSYFMILSGFVLSLGYYEKIENSDFNFKRFMGRRLIKIYPLHLLCLLANIILVHDFSSHTMVCTMPSIFLIQAWFPVSDIYYGGNGLAWFLSDLLFFYLTFPLIVKAVSKLKLRLLLILAFILLPLTLMTGMSLNTCFDVLYTCPLIRLVDFFLGIVVYRIYVQLKGRFSSLSFRMKSFIELSAFVLACISVWLFVTLKIPLGGISFYWLPMSFLVLVFALSNQNGGAFTKILNNKISLRLGDLTFPFYLSHRMATTVSMYVLGFNLWTPLQFLISIFFSFFVAFLLHRYFERPV